VLIGKHRASQDSTGDRRRNLSIPICAWAAILAINPPPLPTPIRLSRLEHDHLGIEKCLRSGHIALVTWRSHCTGNSRPHVRH
jgi:hypothetical protein